ncbi:hypothetical protein Athai_07880 [Actinocatenispora thailandica]|uniref:SseB protein N-terminal domain-containing protein n=1 Tax=Actinocatenispora thailandica TaxID=227318 RepID=A0A7R7DKE1_9ACTN|nr:hypothetical protein [Actinocatenispora thailandica]BCJ33285.1 hypothetical protein Athai_07880 [Actinocatenispora thailandica]
MAEAHGDDLATRRALRRALLDVAAVACPDCAPVVERERGPFLVEVEPPTGAGRYVCAATVATAPPGMSWSAPELVRAAADALTGRGWAVGAEPTFDDRQRYELRAERPGHRVVASVRADEGILRFAGWADAAPPEPVAAAPRARPADGWSPAGELQAALQAAVDRGDERRYVGLLLDAPLYLPASGDAAAEFATVVVDGLVHLVAFTAPASGLGTEGGYRATTYLDLAQRWPDPGWRLAVDPGTPIEAYLPAPSAADGAVRLPAGPPRGPADAEPFRPLNALEVALSEAVRADDRDAIFAALGADGVLVWMATSTADLRPADPGFGWPLVPMDGGLAVCVFTAPQRAAGALGVGVEVTPVELAEVAAGWPDRTYRLVVDPGGPLAVTVPGFVISSLVRG